MGFWNRLLTFRHNEEDWDVDTEPTKGEGFNSDDYRRAAIRLISPRIPYVGPPYAGGTVEQCDAAMGK